jgi:hypothetical protein
MCQEYKETAFNKDHFEINSLMLNTDISKRWISFESLQNALRIKNIDSVRREVCKNENSVCNELEMSEI